MVQAPDGNLVILYTTESQAISINNSKCATLVPAVSIYRMNETDGTPLQGSYFRVSNHKFYYGGEGIVVGDDGNLYVYFRFMAREERMLIKLSPTLDLLFSK